MFKDSRQFMWLGTENGLFRFDGTHIKYIRHYLGDTTSLPYNTINSITEDKNGFLWIGTNGGIARMNAYNFRCKVFNSAFGTLNYDGDNKIMIDESGIVWAINAKGLSRLNSKQEKFEEVWNDIKNNEPQSRFILSISSYNHDELVLGTYTDIVFINKKNYDFRRVPVDAQRPNAPISVIKILVDDYKNLWIGTWAEGLFKYDADRQQFNGYKWDAPINNNQNNIVVSFAVTYSGADEILWAATFDGVLKIPVLNYKAPDIHHIILYPGSEFQKKNQEQALAINSILTDDAGILWVGGSIVGRLATHTGAFRNFDLSMSGEKVDLQKTFINGIPYYFISAWHGKYGMAILDSDFHIIKRSDEFKQLHTEDAQNISGIATDSSGRIWISTLAGIFIMDKNFHIIDKIDKARKHDTLTKLKTNSVFIQGDLVWIACYKKGVDLFDTRLHKIHHYDVNDGSGLKDDIVWKFFADKKNNLWLCGNNYLYKYVPSKESFIAYALSTESNGCTPHEIAEREDGTLLVASNNGLIHFDPITEKYEYLNSPLLDKEEKMMSVCTDTRGNAWCLTEAHLVFYDFDRNSFTVFGGIDGINGNPPGFLIRRFDSEELLIAQGNGLTTFNQKDIKPRSDAPSVIITQTQVNDTTIQADSPIKNLDLNYNQNKILFEFTGITYYKPEQNTYAYQLSGVDKNWINTNRNISVYTNLSPGDYVFRVKAANYAGNWGPVYPIAIHINTPFWKTWWFVTICAIFFIGFIYSIYKYRLEQRLRLERLRSKISTDLHDDIGSTLSSISILSDMILKEKKESQSVEMASVIKDNSLSLMEKMDDIVWSINPRNDSLENLMLRIQQFASNLFEAKDIEYNITIHNNLQQVKLPMEFRQHMYLILKEAINNIVKYAKASHVTIDVTHNNSILEVKISDNGCGFITGKLPRGNGIMNMQSRAKAMKATLNINSAINQGTQIDFKVKIK